MSRFYQIYLTGLVVVLIEQALTINQITNRIVGGRVTTIENAKYVVSLRKRNGNLLCGGSLVNYRYVVTAAHCLEGIKANNVIVHGGTTYLRERGIRRAVMRIIKPAVFNINTLIKDVAVLKLRRPLRGNNIATIPLCSRDLSPMTCVHVFGWGKVRENVNGPSNQLRVTDVCMISNEKCAQSYGSMMNLTNTMMCAAIPGATDSCFGDSGGPLEFNGELCGIVSFGIGCARTQYPGVYTSINAVKGFIRKAMQS